MNMQEFYAKYNLSKDRFAILAGVGTRSLNKFAKGESIRSETKERIEHAMRIAEKYDLVCPKYDRSESIRQNNWNRTGFDSKHRAAIYEYKKLFKELLEKERV